MVLVRPDIRIRPDLIGPIVVKAQAYTRGEAEHPVSMDPNPTDAILFEDAKDAAKKIYLPRYAVRVTDAGRYDLAVAASGDGAWIFKVGLKTYPAPEIGPALAGASEAEHSVEISLTYGSGLQRTVPLIDPVRDDKGLSVSARLTTEERDRLLGALRSESANPRLQVVRTMTLAVRSPNDDGVAPTTLTHGAVMLNPSIRRLIAGAPALRMAALKPAIRRFDVASNPSVVAAVTRPEAAPQVIKPVIAQEKYRTQEKVFPAFAASPDPFLFDPLLHPYLYEVAGGVTSGRSDAPLKRIAIASAAGGTRFFAYFQDPDDGATFYYLPDGFRLARRDEPPCLPAMNIDISTDPENPSIETAKVNVHYVARPYVSTERLAAALVELAKEAPATGGKEPRLWPLPAKSELRLRLPSGAGVAMKTYTDAEVGIDLGAGFAHDFTVPLADFHKLYAAACGSESSGLFTGEVRVQTGLSTPEVVPVEIRFGETEGEVFEYFEEPRPDGVMAVRLRNAIESPLTIKALTASLARGDAVVAGKLQGLDLTQPIVLKAGEEVAFEVTPQAALDGDAALDALFDLRGVEITPDAEAILPAISEESVPATYTRMIEVMTLPALLSGGAAASDPIIMINVTLKGGGSARLTPDAATVQAAVNLPLTDVLLGRDDQGRYRYKQQVIHQSGAQKQDDQWREADFDVLVVPVT